MIAFTSKSLGRSVLLSLLAVTLLVMWLRQIDDRPITSDAVEWEQAAVNLGHHGMFSMDAREPLKPTNFREPLPSVAIAGALLVSDAIEGQAADDAYFSGPRLRSLKYQNLVWLALWTAGAFWSAARLTDSWWMGLCAAILANIPFRPQYPPGFADDLMTEIPYAAVLILASTSLALGVSKSDRRLLAIAGLLFGAATLIKAITLYIFLVLLALVLPILLLRRAKVWVTASSWLLLLLPFALVVLPWIARNHEQLGTYQITQRASYALVERSLEDGMSATEFRGAIYIWAPFMKQQLGRWLGFSAADLAPDGRLARLNDDPESQISTEDAPFEESAQPEKVTTFYRKARAEIARSRLQFQAAGRPFPDVDAEAFESNVGMTAIKAHPLPHLGVTLLLLWRTSAISLLILTAALLVAAKLRRLDLALFMLPSLGLVLAYALVSNDVPRYDKPVHFICLVLLPILAVLTYRSIQSKWPHRSHNDEREIRAS